MGDDIIQDGPQNHSQSKDDKAAGKQVKEHKLKPELAKRRICEVLGGGAFILALCIHGLWFWIFMIPAAIACGYSLRLELKHFGYKKRPARAWGTFFFCMIVIGSLIYWIQAQSAIPKPPPPLAVAKMELGIFDSDSRGEPLMLTNSFLVPTNPTVIEPDTVPGFVIIPAATNASTVKLELVLQNMSDADAEEVFVGVSYETNGECVADGRWQVDDHSYGTRGVVSVEINKVGFGLLVLPPFILKVIHPQEIPILTSNGPGIERVLPYPDLTFSVDIFARGILPIRRQFHVFVIALPEQPTPSPYVRMFSKITSGTKFKWNMEEGFFFTNSIDVLGNKIWLPAQQ